MANVNVSNVMAELFTFFFILFAVYLSFSVFCGYLYGE